MATYYISLSAVPVYNMLYWCILCTCIHYISGFAQDCSDSSALALELLQSCSEPSIYIRCKHTSLLPEQFHYNNSSLFVWQIKFLDWLSGTLWVIIPIPSLAVKLSRTHGLWVKWLIAGFIPCRCLQNNTLILIDARSIHFLIEWSHLKWVFAAGRHE